MPTLAELNAQQAALTKALAEHELPLHEEAAELLTELVASDAVTRLAAIVADMPDSGAKNSLANVRAAISAASGLISMHLPLLRELATGTSASASTMTPTPGYMPPMAN